MNIKDLPVGSYKVVDSPTNINQLPVGSYRIVGQATVPMPTIKTEYQPTFEIKPEEGYLKTALKTLGNIPGSAWNFGKALVQMFNPIHTFQTLSQIPGEFRALVKESGGTEQALKYTAPELLPTTYKLLTPKFIQQAVKGDANGSLQTITEDPVGQIAPILLLARGAAEKLGRGAEFDSMMTTIAKPVTVPAKYIGGKISAGVKGLVSGAGGESITTAYGAGKTGLRGTEFTKAMRGETQPGDIIDMANAAADTIAAQKEAQYVSQLTKIQQASPKLGELDTTKIYDELNAQLGNFKIGVKKDGTLNFESSPIRNQPSAVADIKTAYEDITRWTDNSAVGLDSLKRELGQIYSQSADSRAFITRVKNAVGDTLKDNVPGYEAMMSDYQKASGFQGELKSLSIGGKANADTILRKLTSAMRQNNEIRLQILDELQKQSSLDIKQALAGYQFSSLVPRGIIGKGIDVGILFNMFSNPRFLFGLLTTSPRVVGEFFNTLGFTQAKTASILKMLDEMRVFYALGTTQQEK
jgi:hypothetical protein